MTYHRGVVWNPMSARDNERALRELVRMGVSKMEILDLDDCKCFGNDIDVLSVLQEEQSIILQEIKEKIR